MRNLVNNKIKLNEYFNNKLNIYNNIEGKNNKIINFKIKNNSKSTGTLINRNRKCSKSNELFHKIIIKTKVTQQSINTEETDNNNKNDNKKVKFVNYHDFKYFSNKLYDNLLNKKLINKKKYTKIDYIRKSIKRVVILSKLNLEFNLNNYRLIKPKKAFTLKYSQDLFYYIRFQNIKKIKELLNRNRLLVYQIDKLKMTVLHHAAKNDNIELANILLNYSPLINEKDIVLL